MDNRVAAYASEEQRELLREVCENWLHEGFSSDAAKREQVKQWALALGSDPVWIRDLHV